MLWQPDTQTAESSPRAAALGFKSEPQHLMIDLLFEIFLRRQRRKTCVFAFLGTVKIGEGRLAEMTDVDHAQTESLIATAPGDQPRSAENNLGSSSVRG